MQLRQMLVWHIAGTLSLAFVIHFWLLMIDPWKIGLHYPGEVAGFAIGVLLALLLSLLAAWKGSRYWFTVTTAVLATRVAVIVRMH